ncbi:MAG TPA: hypothetical protein VMU54_22565 [Planctomycetota bacterium]|nr:hypothetical protein [Planctomycetota bacterium]
MPHTFNGVGTHYYGKANLLERPGSCEFCGQPATIQSYDTRYWFVILFIPIIPLGRKRIIDQCGRCRRHRAAKLADWLQVRAKAMEEGMRKVVDQPGALEPLAELHRTCLVFGEWEKADQLGARMEQEFPENPKAHLHLAQAHAYRGRVAEYGKSIQRAQELDPALAKEAEAIGSSPAPKPAGKTRQRILLGILGALVLGGFLLIDWFNSTHRTLHVINGYGIPLEVRLPGLPELSVSPLMERSIELPEGSYTAQVTGPLSAEIPFAISSHLLIRLFDERTFVLNPGGMGLLVREETIYSSDRSDHSSDIPPFSIHYGKPFEIFKDIDYAFSSFPREIKMDTSGTVHKRRVGLVTMPVPRLVHALLESNRGPEALSLAEWAIDGHSSKADVVSAYAEAAANPAYRERIVGALKSRLGRRPVEIALHRAYQNLLRESPEHTLEPEYEAALAADPGNSALLYLRGRVVSGIASSLGYFDRAVLADPDNAFAHAAVAHCRCAQGKWTEALAPALRACELDPGNAGFQDLLEDIRISLRQFDVLEKDLRARCARTGWGPSASLTSLINLLAFRKDTEGALKLCEDLRHPPPGIDIQARQALATELRCRAFYAAGDLAALALEVGKAQKDRSTFFRFALLIEQGRLEEADALADKEAPAAFETLDRSIAWFLKGNEPRARELRHQAAELLQKRGHREMQTAGSLLLSDPSLDMPAVANLDLPPSSKAIILTALAQAHPESAPDLIRGAQALNTGWVFPRFLLERALTALGEKR